MRRGGGARCAIFRQKWLFGRRSSACTRTPWLAGAQSACSTCMCYKKEKGVSRLMLGSSVRTGPVITTCSLLDREMLHSYVYFTGIRYRNFTRSGVDRTGLKWHSMKPPCRGGGVGGGGGSQSSREGRMHLIKSSNCGRKQQHLLGSRT